MKLLKVFVRAKCVCGKWVNVPAEDLEEESFKKFLLHKMAEAGIVFASPSEEETILRTATCKCE